MYVISGTFTSKQEACEWGVALPEELSKTIQKILDGYRSEEVSYKFDDKELLGLKGYIHRNVQVLL